MPAYETTEESSGTTAAPIPSFTPNTSICIPKLKDDNFHVWRSLVIPYLKGQGVFGFVDGSIKEPPKTITVGSAVQANPQHPVWEKTDSLILSIINTSIDTNVLARVHNTETSAQMWAKLHTLYASRSKARVAYLRSALSSTRLEDKTVTEYYIKMRNLADEMCLAGYPMDDDEFLTYLLPGLGENYESLIQRLGTAENVSLEDIFAQILSAEARAVQNQLAANGSKSAAASTGPPAQANYARSSSSHQQTNANRNSYGQQPSGHSYGQQQGNRNYGQFQGNYRGRGGRNGGRGRGRNSGDPNAICQICSKQGHTAKECYFRYKESNDPAAIQPPSRPQPPPHAYAMQYGAYPPPPYPYPYPSFYPPPPPNEWVADTGASHHLTPDPRNLNLHSEPYEGPDKVHVGDGSGSFGTRSS